MERTGTINNKEIIVCKNISKSFLSKKKEELIIDDISFNIYENEFLVIFGPGQCGKTTLLYMIAGIVPTSKGQILHGDELVTKPDKSRAVVYQTIALFPWLTVKGNVEFGPKVQKIAKEEADKRTQKYIDLVGLQGFENSFPTQLSGGMKQRVGIARAYCSEPNVLLMDEPFGHLDAQTRYMMQESLENIWTKNKRTVVFVTNNIEEAIYLADRIILLTNCPSKISKEYKIDLPRPRNIVDEKFLLLRQEITDFMEKYQ